MTFKNLFFAALFAASAVAAPHPADAGAGPIAKRFEPGTCTFHIYESVENATLNPKRSLKVEFWDNQGNLKEPGHKDDEGKWVGRVGREPFYTFDDDVTEDAHALPITPDGFDAPITFSIIGGGEHKGPETRIEGWSFSYKGQKWDTNTQTPEHHSTAQDQPVRLHALSSTVAWQY